MGKVDYRVESYLEPDESGPYPHTIFEKTSVVRLVEKFYALFEMGKVDYPVESYPEPDESSPNPYTIFEKTSVFRLARKFHALFDRGRLITTLRAIHSQMNPVRILTPYLRRRASFVWPGNSMPCSTGEG